jgi:peptidoglycan/xylan/chitin deacetylase (PgdA/CDA1 family)
MAGIWPGDIQCVALLTFDIDGASGSINRNPNAVNMPSLLSMGEYGPKVAMPRILDMLESYDIKSTFFVPGFIAENNEELMKDIVLRGHEVGHHGYMHEPPATLTAEEEWAVLEKGISILEQTTGRRPLGYRSPSWELSQRSLEYLASLEFKYDTSLMGDDAPYYVSTAKGRLVELPIHWLLDDAPHFSYSPATQRAGPMKSPDEVYLSWKAEFDGLYRYGRSFHLTMHPHVIGRPGRLSMLERLINYIRSFPNTAFMRAIDVAEMWTKD